MPRYHGVDDERIEAMRARDRDELLSVIELAAEMGRSEPTAWAYVRRLGLTKYTVPARGRTVLIRRGEFVDALTRPQEIKAAA